MAASVRPEVSKGRADPSIPHGKVRGGLSNLPPLTAPPFDTSGRTGFVRRALSGRLGLVRRALAAASVALFTSGAWADTDAGGELRLRWDARSANPAGPLADANRLAPGIASATPNAAVAEAELNARWKLLSAKLLLASERHEGGSARSTARFNELVASGDFGAWQASVGKKVVGWDVGHGFRPNDFVQQAERRTLLALPQEGRPLLQLEHFKAESATSLVWVNPQRIGRSSDAQRRADESAFALRWYTRAGAADWHLFGRAGQHTGASAGAAFAWVASDALALHASARLMQRHDGWRIDPAAGVGAVSANPWRLQTRGGAAQWLLGASWTGEAQQSVIAEWWYDGTALADGEWDRWQARGDALSAVSVLPGLPAGTRQGLAGNLAWQATPFAAPNLRRDNLFVRLAWQPDHWLFTLDALITPADGGHVVTAGLQWQGDRVRLNAAWRTQGGPADALFAQLPQRRSGAVSAAWAF
ncbi:hypothetical protein BURC_02727 [Burkholderiaceae bacterium]|nr:hypothetical protein BURC_02727 [Burkholderiaceae bacterium]